MPMNDRPSCSPMSWMVQMFVIQRRRRLRFAREPAQRFWIACSAHLGRRATAPNAESFRGSSVLVSFLLVFDSEGGAFAGSESFHRTCFTSTPRIDVLGREDSGTVATPVDHNRECRK